MGDVILGFGHFDNTKNFFFFILLLNCLKQIYGIKNKHFFFSKKKNNRGLYLSASDVHSKFQDETKAF